MSERPAEPTRLADSYFIDNWKQRFREVIAVDHRARRSLEALKERGCDPDEITGLLALSCAFDGNPVFRAIEKMRAHIARHTTEALRLAKRLEDDCGMLKEFSPPLPESTLDKMSEAVVLLRSEANVLRTLFSKHKLNTGFFLSWLISSVEEKTGTPRYREVSYLLECAYSAYGKESPFIGEEALRKMHRHFIRTSPFKGLMSAEGKRNVLFFSVIFYAIQHISSLPSNPTPPTEMSPQEQADFLAEISKLFPEE